MSVVIFLQAILAKGRKRSFSSSSIRLVPENNFSSPEDTYRLQELEEILVHG
jgi:hypothetical protein